eukprot:gene36946-48207_t
MASGGGHTADSFDLFSGLFRAVDFYGYNRGLNNDRRVAQLASSIQARPKVGLFCCPLASVVSKDSGSLACTGKTHAAGRDPSVQKNKAESGTPPAVRVIKKYPNRRLYDTDTSTYITLAEVRQLVMDHQQVVVRDAKTGEDLTRSILLQIILEEEAGGAPMFTEAVLANIIRFYGHAMQGFMGAYLEKNVQAFTDVQTKLAEQSQSVTPEMWAQFMNLQSPMLKGMMGNYVEQSQSMLTQMQEQMQKQTEQMLGAFGIKRSMAGLMLCRFWGLCCGHGEGFAEGGSYPY